MCLDISSVARQYIYEYNFYIKVWIHQSPDTDRIH